MSKPIKIRTRYQRMRLAYLLAETLKEHPDPKVQEKGIEITYALAAPMSTLNNLLDQFPPDLIRRVSETPDESAELLQRMRELRAASI
jgi:hypothetical protein